MSLKKRILEAAVGEIAFVDGVFQVDAVPRRDKDGNFYVDIDTDDGGTMRLALKEIKG